MTLRDGWAAASVRLLADDVTNLALPEELAAAGRINKDRTVLSIKIELPDGSTLGSYLDGVRKLLHEHRLTLAGLTNCAIDVHLGWSPRSPQDGITFTSDLVEIVAAVGGSIVLDTYAD